MNLTNFHSHCSFCDGRAPMEDFVKAAIDAGFSAYGVSSHAPLPFETRWSISVGKVEEYLAEFQRLKEKYAAQIELYVGLEIDYLNEKWNPASSFFQELALDYRIGSVHLMYTDAGEIIDIDTNPENFRTLLLQYFQGDLEGIVRRYYDSTMQLVEKGGFDFIGHADKVSFNAEYCRSGVSEEDWYKRLREDLFTFIAGKGIRVEINTKAFMKKGYFFPGKEHFALLKRLGIPIVVNSDAHFPELINAGRKEALEALKEAGFQTVSELYDGKWIEVEIA